MRSNLTRFVNGTGKDDNSSTETCILNMAYSADQDLRTERRALGGLPNTAHSAAQEMRAERPTFREGLPPMACSEALESLGSLAFILCRSALEISNCRVYYLSRFSDYATAKWERPSTWQDLKTLTNWLAFVMGCPLW